MEFLRSLLRRRFARAQVATSRDVGCFLRLQTVRNGVFSGVLNEFQVLSVVFVQAKTEIISGHAVMFLATSRTKILSQQPPNYLSQDSWLAALSKLVF